MAKELAEYDEEAVSNFDRYSSSDLYCSACDRFIGYGSCYTLEQLMETSTSV